MQKLSSQFKISLILYVKEEYLSFSEIKLVSQIMSWWAEKLLYTIYLDLGYLHCLCTIHWYRLEVQPVWAAAIGEIKSCFIRTKFSVCL